MNGNECTGCGNPFTKSDEFCKYCGNKNPKYQKRLFSNLDEDKTNDSFSSNDNSNTKSNTNVTNAKTGKKMNIPLLIVLLLLCQVGAIIYLIWFVIE